MSVGVFCDGLAHHDRRWHAPAMRTLGIDFGTVRIGLAISDPSGTIATPFATIDARPVEAAVDQIERVAKEQNVDDIVIGLPLELDGREGFAVRRVRDFGRRVGERLGLTVHEWDERLTSVDAERSLIDARVRREKRRKVVDQVAAMLILQAFLDRTPGEGPDER